jgi:hypothetical protein
MVVLKKTVPFRDFAFNASIFPSQTIPKPLKDPKIGYPYSFLRHPFGFLARIRPLGFKNDGGGHENLL